jgi:hypothetical protein
MYPHVRVDFTERCILAFTGFASAVLMGACYSAFFL